MITIVIVIRLLLLILHIYQMLFASCLSFILTRSLIHHAIFSKTWPPQGVDYFACYWSVAVKCLPRDTAIHCSVQESELRADNLTTLRLSTCALIH